MTGVRLSVGSGSSEASRAAPRLRTTVRGSFDAFLATADAAALGLLGWDNSVI